jgi:hypothetical protein
VVEGEVSGGLRKELRKRVVAMDRRKMSRAAETLHISHFRQQSFLTIILTAPRALPALRL